MMLRRLEYFIAVAERLSFSQAAKDIHVSQPSLSQQVSALEQELGVKLLSRDKHAVELTRAGAVLLDGARAILGLVDETVMLACQAGVEAPGDVSLRLGVEVNDSQELNILLNRALADLMNLYPGAVFSSTRPLPSECFSMLLKGELDAACMYIPDCRPLPPDLEVRKILSDEMLLIVHYSWQGDLEEIRRRVADSVMLLDDDDLWSHLDREILDKLDLRPREIHTADAGFAPARFFGFVEQEQGVCMATRGQLKKEGSPFVRGIPLERPEAKLSISAVWRKDNDNPVLPLFLRKLASRM